MPSAQSKRNRADYCQRTGHHHDHPVMSSVNRGGVCRANIDAPFCKKSLPALANKVCGGARIRGWDIASLNASVPTHRGADTFHVASAESGGKTSRSWGDGDSVATVGSDESQCVVSIHLNERSPRDHRGGKHVDYRDDVVIEDQSWVPQPRPRHPRDERDQWQIVEAGVLSTHRDRNNRSRTHQPSDNGKHTIEARSEHSSIVAGAGH